MNFLHSTILTLFIVPSCIFGSPNIKTKLYDDLMANYTRDMRPNLNATKVKLDPAIYSIIDIDEARESLVMSQWFEMTWVDELLTWDPAKYGGIKKLRIIQARVFIPDIMVYQLIHGERMGTLEDSFITVAYDGTVFMTRSELLTVHCNFDVSMFPYDKQRSNLTYVAWAHPASEISLVPGTAPNARDAYFQKSTEWELLGYTVSAARIDYGEEIGAWDELTYTIHVERKPFYYIITLTVPSFMLINLAIIGVFSPSSSNHDRTEKVSIGLTALLTMAVILMMVSDLMPKNSTSFPNLGGVLFLCSLLVGIQEANGTGSVVRNSIVSMALVYWYCQLGGTAVGIAHWQYRCVTEFDPTGKYIMWEMTLMAVGTVLSVGWMYLNGMAAFDYPVPQWLSRLVLGKHSVTFSTSSSTSSSKLSGKINGSCCDGTTVVSRQFNFAPTHPISDYYDELPLYDKYNTYGLTNGYIGCGSGRSSRVSASKMKVHTHVLNAAIGEGDEPQQKKMLNSMKQLHQAVRSLEHLLSGQINQMSHHEQIKDEWMRVCGRLDLISMIVAIITNSIVTAVFYFIL